MLGTELAHYVWLRSVPQGFRIKKGARPGPPQRAVRAGCERLCSLGSIRFAFEVIDRVLGSKQELCQPVFYRKASKNINQTGLWPFEYGRYQLLK